MMSNNVSVSAFRLFYLKELIKLCTAFNRPIAVRRAERQRFQEIRTQQPVSNVV